MKPNSPSNSNCSPNIRHHQENHDSIAIENTTNIEIRINQEKKKKWFEKIGSILIFIIVLIAYVTQSELSQLIQNQSDYQKPYLLLYLTHSSYLLILPLHLLILKLINLSSTRTETLNDWFQLKSIFIDQYRFEDLNNHHQRTHSLDVGHLVLHNEEIRTIHQSKHINQIKSNLPLRRFLIRSIQLTFLIALPSLSWFASVSLIDLTSVTAIYNSNAFFAYLFSLWLLKLELISLKKIISVLISLIGVLIITFSNPISKTNTHVIIIDQQDLSVVSQSTTLSTTHRLLGTTLALLGSLTYAGYEVWYKKLISLPDPELLNQSLTLFSSKTVISNSPQGERHSSDQEESTGLLSSSESQTERSKSEIDLINRLLNVSPQIILLHANLITSLIGFFTLTLLWIPIPFLHFFKFESFELPSDLNLIFLILGMISMGVIFNAGFMVLLGLWGPVVASVGNLCTLVLVAISDLILIPNYHLNFSISMGCILISTAFLVLVIDLFHK